ncbi:MAG: hypothetical protein ACE5O2_01460 [Armatimonadota bacterium]
MRVAALASEHPFYAELARLESAAEGLETGQIQAQIGAEATPLQPGRLAAGEPPATSAASHKPPMPTATQADTLASPPDAGFSLDDLPPAARAALAEMDEDVRESAAAAEAAARAMATEARDTSPSGLTDEKALADERRREVEAAAAEARKQAADALRNKRQELYQIILSETATACRKIALERGLDVSVGAEPREGAPDMTEDFRPWLREHWAAAR